MMKPYLIIQCLPDERGAVKFLTIPLYILGGILALIVIGVIVSAISNIGLPTQSKVVDHLSARNKARLAEYFKLHTTLGPEIWHPSEPAAGWGESLIPVIVHNEAYAFLVGYPGDPPDGWEMIPSGKTYGGPWEIVPDDTFRGKPYFRQPLPESGRTPENFTVRVGSRWVATLFTKEYAKVQFYQGFRQDLPPFLRPIVPYRLLYSVVLGPTETYIEGLAHESFHAYQGMNAPSLLSDYEGVRSMENTYPWEEDAVREAWKEELSLLHEGAKAAGDAERSDEEIVELARAFLTARRTRRNSAVWRSTLTDYERKREWVEGLAKYSELTIGLRASRAVQNEAYDPVEALADDPRFKGYRTQPRYWNAQIDEIQRMASREGEIRFYYGGMAQAVMLDRLMDDWKSRIWEEGVWLEDLLAEAVDNRE